MAKAGQYLVINLMQLNITVVKYILDWNMMMQIAYFIIIRYILFVAIVDYKSAMWSRAVSLND